MVADPPGSCVVIVEVLAAGSVTRLSIVGDAPEFGEWDLSRALHLRYGSPAPAEATGVEEDSTLWSSDPITLPRARFPLRLRCCANWHRHALNTRPLVWDQAARVFSEPPPDGVLRCDFEPTADNSDSGWVHSAGVGAFQLRVGQPAGSSLPLVELEPFLRRPHRVELYEAVAGDPAVPAGKSFARLSYADMGVEQGDEEASADDGATFLLNAQSLESLAFRIDVVDLAGGGLLARGFVAAQALAALEGSLSAALVTPDLRSGGTFHADFLVVTALQHPSNNLDNLQRARWAPNAETLDIGHRGSGASAAFGHSIRENTLLSFQKAALNHSDFVEFDVHLTADGAVVVHHDFEVKLGLGEEEVRVPLSALRFAQLPGVARYMLTPTEHRRQPAIQGERDRLQSTLKRSLTSGEDMYRGIFKPPMAASPEAGDGLAAARAFLSDHVASLREVFRRTPPWLGFNIELKYPSSEEASAMSARFYSRSHFVDAVLRVVLEMAGGRRVIFSTFDPGCAALLSLKQPRHPVLFLTCGGTKLFADPRMNSLDAALRFALAARLQGVVAEATSVLAELEARVAEAHRHGLFLFTWGDANNELSAYLAQKAAGVDGVILDDVARIARATNKAAAAAAVLFASKPMRSPSSLQELCADPAAADVLLQTLSSSGELLGAAGSPARSALAALLLGDAPPH